MKRFQQESKADKVQIPIVFSLTNGVLQRKKIFFRLKTSILYFPSNIGRCY